LDGHSSTSTATLISADVRLFRPLPPPAPDAQPAPDAASPERGPELSEVRGRVQRGVGLHGPGERSPRLAEVADVGELPGRRIQCQ